MIDLSFYKGKNVFLTGHTGFKGTWLTRVLYLAGANVTGFSLKPPTVPSLFELTGTSKLIKSIIGDIRSKESLISAVNQARPEILIHMAAQPLVRLSYSDPFTTYETNVMGTVNVLEAVRECSTIKSFVNVTTDKVYENKEWLWGYRENENLCGYDPYSNSKSCSELVTYSYNKSFFGDDNAPAISTARSGNVIGGGDYALDRIIPDCVRSAITNKPIIIRNPHSTRPYQHVLECLSGYLLLVQKQYEDKKRFEGSYNFGPDDSSCISTGELTKLFCKTWDEGLAWINKSETDAPHESHYLKLDCSKAKNVLGWKPVWDIKTSVTKIVEWYKSLQNGMNPDEITDKQIYTYFLK